MKLPIPQDSDIPQAFDDPDILSSIDDSFDAGLREDVGILLTLDMFLVLDVRSACDSGGGPRKDQRHVQCISSQKGM